MQIFFKENIALLSVPKTGTTAYEGALKSKADIIFRGRKKHMSAGVFDSHVAPFLRKTYRLTPERVAVMREPLDHLKSWYRYRTRDALLGNKRSTRGISFEQFVRDAISEDVPPHANVGTQARFLTAKDGAVPLHHLFAYEAQPLLLDFFETRFKTRPALKRPNQSPKADTSLSPETEAAFRAARSEDYALYARITEAGGHLQLLLDE